ncbi:hypothetical protein AJ85_16390 [Alkalihalobacillus alcalophilus ATCC 27647 = CGMCC 1.3604]|uniref:SPOR domain-containing protein n=1 Tax=Alkalihalobacillus alcalophilus ATCC 27647 = CGMCC 1.3604 TaxID=1218173 RepID=A0A094WL72_ALKAL|nr:hypothetical protein [Alkalihalobacillus alcalophilus]KGA97611.1 hypothetical protein BALCAV_0209160 [Alkalihalobacillus alcalophilus ATCC 27647 = CGMCC 1.3604]MED1561398.1 hypothetical protein [Alkalihalobacillus alcalophilus]THG92196.1 hypothetical protein AJ85_16390 [Alkalihalobacillus alcalophilus ATCC 27647 = CGMCC 1.3604]
MGSEQEKRTISIKLNQPVKKVDLSSKHVTNRQLQQQIEERQEVQPIKVDKKKDKIQKKNQLSEEIRPLEKRNAKEPFTKQPKTETVKSFAAPYKNDVVRPFLNKQKKEMDNLDKSKRNMRPIPHIFPDTNGDQLQDQEKVEEVANDKNGKENPSQKSQKVDLSTGRASSVNNSQTYQNEIEQGTSSEMELEVPLPNDKVIDFGQLQEERKRNAAPFWDDGNREQGPSLPYKRKKKKKGNFSFQDFPVMTVMAILSAIIVGLSFGFVIKTIFTGESDVSITQNGAVPVMSNNGVDAGATNHQLQWPRLTAEVVQAGAFSTLEKGNEMNEQMLSNGFPSVLLADTESFYLFIGLAADRAEAQNVSAYFVGEGQETYVKTYQINGDSVPPSVESQAWFEEAIQLFQQLSTLSAAALTKEATISASQLDTSTNKMNALSEQRDVAFSNLPDEIKPYALEMADRLKEANAALASYNESQSGSDAIKVQQALLSVLNNYSLMMNTKE